MNKTELAKAVMDKSRYQHNLAETEEFINSLIDVIKDEVGKGGTVQLIGFGTFGSTNRAARTGRNPQTGETLNIPAMRVPKFTPGKAFKEATK